MFTQHGYAWGRLKPNPMIANSAWFLAAPPREQDIITLMPYIIAREQQPGHRAMPPIGTGARGGLHAIHEDLGLGVVPVLGRP